MFAVSIRYPREPGREFSFRHWAETHMPLGVALLDRTSGHAPAKVMIQHSVFGLDGRPSTADSYAIVWLLFDSREGLDGFLKLHNDSIASSPLAEDVQHYAPVAPSLMLGEMQVFEDVGALLSRGRRLLGSRAE